MIRRLLFRLHWLLGITAGLVLAVMGVTGAAMSWQDELLAALNPGIVTLPADGRAPLAPAALAAAIERRHPDAPIRRLQVESDPTRAARVTFAARGEGQAALRYLDPRDGRLLPRPRGEALFATIEDVHRWLALPGGGRGWGRQVTAIAALSLLYFALSGLYLRWPREPRRWRAWFAIDLRRTGANLHRALHIVAGTVLLPFYLLSALTGLWWSYPWYQQGVRYMLTGSATEPGERGGGGGGGGGARRGKRAPAAAAGPSLATAWAGFDRAVPGAARYRSVTALVAGPGAPVRFRAILQDARHARVTDEYLVDGRTGRLVRTDLYATRPTGRRMALAMFELHRGAWFGTVGRVAMMLASLAMPLFAVTGLLLYRARRRKARALAGPALPLPAPAPAGGDGPLIVHASQGGRAQRIAERTAAAFPGARVRPLHELDADALAGVTRALFVVSTYGDGQPPDRARGFARRTMAEPLALPQLDYALLALGDREYPGFCRFGDDVDRWLGASGARRSADTLRADGDDPAALGAWFASVGAAAAEAPGWQPWRLVERRLLNPGSAGGAIHHVRLIADADGDGAHWHPGDIAEIVPRQDAARIAAFLAARGGARDAAACERLAASELVGRDGGFVADAGGLRPIRPRDYSIASIAESGAIDLVVRSTAARDGSPGVGSHWLGQALPVGGTVPLRIRANPGFRVADARTPLILIGNGTGIAGLIAHLRHRAYHGGAPAWLMLGERNARHDALFDAELAGQLARGTLARLDRCWSRDGAGRDHVQHLLARCGNDVRRAVAGGAAILVCGSRAGMAPAVDTVLRTLLGDATLERLARDNRYLRDVY